MSLPNVSAARIRSLMAKSRVTVREVAVCYNLTMKRVRDVRKNGGPWDWPDIIRGTAAIKAGSTLVVN